MKQDDLKNAKPGDTIWDKGEKTSVTGLHLRVSDSGRKTFMLYYRTKTGKQRKPKIGDLGQVTLAEARKRAKAIMDSVAIGQDPQGEWSEARGEPTVNDLYEAVRDRYWTPKYAESGHAYIVDLNYKNHIKPTFGTMKLSEVTLELVEEWMGSFKENKTSANRCHEAFNTMFNKAKKCGVRFEGQNPCKGVERNQTTSRDRYVQHDELRAIAKVLQEEASVRPIAVAFIYTLLYTGSRPSLLERATWDQVQSLQKDGETFGVITRSGKATGKTGKRDIVVIPPVAFELICSLPRNSDGRIFGIKHPKNFWAEIRTRAKVKNLTAYDLRRSFATFGNSAGLTTGTIGKLLNHSSPKTTAIYERLFHEVRVDAVAATVSQIQSALNRKETIQ